MGRLGEQCSIEIGGTPSRNVPEYWDPAKDTSNAWVSIRDLSRRTINSTAEHISDLGAKRSNVKLQAEGTVLLSFKLSIGRVAFAGTPLYTNEAIAGLRSNEINHDFLYFGLQEWDLLQDVDQAIKGATLNKAKLKNIEFHFPPSKPEQTKIAEILSTVDRAIEQTEALIAKQQRLKTGLMQDLLTRGIDEHGNLRSEQTHEFKDSPLGRIPVEWEVKTLGELAEVKGGKRLPSGHSYSASDTDYRYFRVTDFYQKEINYYSLERLEEATFMALHRYEITPGDLCVSIAGSLGYFAVFCPPPGFSTILTENAARLVLVSGVSPSLLCAMLNSTRVQAQIEEEKGVGGGVPKLALFRIRSLLVPFPICEKEQERILTSISAQMDSAIRYGATLAKLRSLKTALMQDLLTGRKRVTALLDGKEVIA